MPKQSLIQNHLEQGAKVIREAEKRERRLLREAAYMKFEKAIDLCGPRCSCVFALQKDLLVMPFGDIDHRYLPAPGGRGHQRRDIGPNFVARYPVIDRDADQLGRLPATTLVEQAGLAAESHSSSEQTAEQKRRASHQVDYHSLIDCQATGLVRRERRD